MPVAGSDAGLLPVLCMRFDVLDRGLGLLGQRRPARFRLCLPGDGLLQLPQPLGAGLRRFSRQRVLHEARIRFQERPFGRLVGQLLQQRIEPAGVRFQERRGARRVGRGRLCGRMRGGRPRVVPGRLRAFGVRRFFVQRVVLFARDRRLQQRAGHRGVAFVLVLVRLRRFRRRRALRLCRVGGDGCVRVFCRFRLLVQVAVLSGFAPRRGQIGRIRRGLLRGRVVLDRVRVLPTGRPRPAGPAMRGDAALFPILRRAMRARGVGFFSAAQPRGPGIVCNPARVRFHVLHRRAIPARRALPAALRRRLGLAAAGVLRGGHRFIPPLAHLRRR